MRIIILLATLLPSIAGAADWIELTTTPEARVMLDTEGMETSAGGTKAWLKFLYHKKQPGQTVTHGKPFDSSTNQYYVVCDTQKYQVLQLNMFYKNKTVGSFSADLNLNNLDQAKLGTGILSLMNKICPANKPDSTNQMH